MHVRKEGPGIEYRTGQAQLTPNSVAIISDSVVIISISASET
jgi:hypothetical protein